MFRRLAILLALGLAVAAAAPATPWEKRIGNVAWLTDYNVGLEKALVMRRPVLLTFYTDWCGWCRRLESKTFPDQRFEELARFTVPVRVNGDREKGLTALLRVSSYPTTILIGRNGREIGRIAGYRDAAEFAELLSALLSRREPLAEAEQAVVDRPGDPVALYHLADVYLSVGRYEEARQALAQVAASSTLAAQGLAGDAVLDGALTHLFAHEYPAALPGLEDYLARFPEGDRRDQALFFYGTALLGSGRRDEGLQKLDEAARITTFEYIKLESDRLTQLAREGTARGQR